MRFDLADIAPMKRYELLLGTVVPRPIALVTTLSQSGMVNAAPYSLFSVMSHDPPVIVFSALPHPDGRMKDTATNILATEEFVINLVSEPIADAMNLTCIDAPPDVSEIGLADLNVEASHSVKPPRISASPVAFECRLHSSLSLAANQLVVFGQVQHVHVPDHLVSDADACVVDTPALQLIGAMHAARFYARTTDLMEMVRPSWADWKRKE